MIDTIDKMYHIQCVKRDVRWYVLLPGDPFRTDLIASSFDNARLVTHNREHKIWIGYLDGVKASVASTGMGCPFTAIALEELIKCGADTFTRMGTAGKVCDAVPAPELGGVINMATVWDEGTTIHCIPIEYPAVADRHVVNALARVAANLGYHYAEGIIQSKDSFYGQHESDDISAAARLHGRWEAWRKGDVVTPEMEAAAIFMISSIHGCRASPIMSFGDVEKTVRVTCDAIRLLIRED